MRPLIFCLSALALLATPARADEAAIAGPTCDFGDVVFDADFEGGRLSACTRTGARAFELAVRPEDAWINPSAWYAFSAMSDAPHALEITVRYVQGFHRYAPKLSRDGGATWSALPVVVEGGAARFSIEAGPEPVLVAAQPLIRAEEVEAWLAGYAGRRDLVAETVGASEEGRPIRMLRTRRARRETLFIVGRQHPPETTGAIALRAFVDRVLAEDDDLARRFRRRFSVEVIPLLNPDGVARGQWRHNSRGVDLNRDWGPFTQVETRVAAAALAEATRDDPRRLALFLDFHSTWHDVFYTQPDDAPGRRMDFPAAWIAATDARLDRAGPVRDPGHNPASPTSKGWVYRTYGAPAITFELGDTTPPDDIERIAVVAAEEAMRLLLDSDRPAR